MKLWGLETRAFKKNAEDAFEAKREHSSLIMVSHSMKTIRDYSDVAILLTGKDLEIHEDVNEAIDQYNVLSGIKSN